MKFVVFAVLMVLVLQAPVEGTKIRFQQHTLEVLAKILSLLKDKCTVNPGDSDSCSAGEHNCDANAVCTPSFTCTCKTGYEGDGLNCTKVTTNGTECPEDQTRGKPCTNDSDCGGNHFICSDGQCDCALSYSYDGESNRCVSKCPNDNYGTEFSLQSSPYCIYKHNNYIYRVNTYSECRAKCLAAPITCRSFELINNRCHISKFIKSDVPARYWARFNGCKYYQRHCG